MEEKNSVFGIESENIDDFDSDKDFSLYRKNKEYAESSINNSAKELTDFFGEVSKDVPELSETEVDAGVKKLLETAFPDEAQPEPSKANKNKKITFRVLFLVALLTVFSFSCLYVVGNNRNISIDNGVISFAKDTIKVIFFGENEEKYMSVNMLLSDLESHGYKDIMFPEEFINRADEYKASVPKYICNDDLLSDQVSFNVYSENDFYDLTIDKNDRKEANYLGVVNASTLKIENVYVNIFEFESGYSSIEYVSNGYNYYINSKIPYFEMIELAKTLTGGNNL